MRERERRKEITMRNTKKKETRNLQNPLSLSIHFFCEHCSLFSEAAVSSRRSVERVSSLNIVLLKHGLKWRERGGWGEECD